MSKSSLAGLGATSAGRASGRAKTCPGASRCSGRHDRPSAVARGRLPFGASLSSPLVSRGDYLPSPLCSEKFAKHPAQRLLQPLPNAVRPTVSFPWHPARRSRQRSRRVALRPGATRLRICPQRSYSMPWRVERSRANAVSGYGLAVSGRGCGPRRQASRKPSRDPSVKLARKGSG